ncbi:MAG: bifunctional oligoribonuclease/PAP phosphatase NrnA [Promethearchaeota archaeon]
MNLRELLKDVRTPLIIGHQNADPDAVCAMIAFARLYLKINPDGSPTLIADDISRLSNQIVQHFAPDMEILSKSERTHDFYILVDTNSRFQLGPGLQDILTNPDRTLVIDHHELNPEIDMIATHQILQSKPSTCQILVEVFEEARIDISSNTANLILTGMIFDTRRFFYTDSDTFSAAIRLIEAGADYEKCVRSLLIRPDRSERIARLKAAGRVKVHLVGDWIVAISKINAYEASACRGLIELGADVALVGGNPKKDVVRLSSRSTRQFFEVTGINLGTDVMKPLGETIEGEGGGHANAAGANGTKNLDRAIERSLQIITTAIGADEVTQEEEVVE